MAGGVTSTADKLIEADKERQEKALKLQEELKQLRDCSNRLFSSKDGQFWARKAFFVMRLRNQDPNIFSNPLCLAADKALYYFYLKMFRDLLNPEILAEIERGE